MAEEKEMKQVEEKPKKENFFQKKMRLRREEKESKEAGKKAQQEVRELMNNEPKVCPEDSYVALHHIHKIYDNGFHAVHDFNIDIKKGEFIVFVGPSGCGKSTTLRMIAGLEDITGGHLFIDHEYMNDIAPKDRGIAMVFQSYALYPHMTVYENMAYPLKIMHLSKEEIDRRVKHAASILQIDNQLDKKPKALSGGQRQRVALGRAIVKHAKVLLMDEPLSNLDAKLRVQMRSEIVNLHNILGATTIYVTHDQTEAMTMASRIVIMKDGYVQQIGTPMEVFNHPVNKFVAGFIGSPSMNFFDGTYENGRITFITGESIDLPPELVEGHNIPNHVIIGLRPENIHPANGAHNILYPDATFEVKVHLAELLGNEYYIHTSFGGINMVAKFPSDHEIHMDDVVSINLNPSRIHLFDPESEKAFF